PPASRGPGSRPGFPGPRPRVAAGGQSGRAQRPGTGRGLRPAGGEAGGATDPDGRQGTAVPPPARAERGMSMRKQVHVYTDGACLGNPGPGGWAALLRYGVRERELVGGEPQTTNNRMELMAAIRALEALTESCEVVLHTDSQYVRKGITEW